MYIKNFRRNLISIIEAGQRTGSDVLISTVVANYRHCAPFSSMHKNGISNSELEKWEQYFGTAKN
jgi:hypothetical protein